MTHLLTLAELNILYLRGMSAKHHNLEYSGVPPTDLLSLLAEIKAQRWRTIDSAPKSGISVLVWAKEYGVLVAEWYADAGAWVAMFVDDSGYIDPTHWMPRPAPPQEDRG